MGEIVESKKVKKENKKYRERESSIIRGRRPPRTPATETLDVLLFRNRHLISGNCKAAVDRPPAGVREQVLQPAAACKHHVIRVYDSVIFPESQLFLLKARKFKFRQV